MSELHETPRTERLRWGRIALLLAGYLLIIVAGHVAGRWLEQYLGFDATSPKTFAAQLILVVGLVLYILLLALPFVPVIEISLALFAIFGPKVAVPIYIATLVALIVSYTAGRFVAAGVLASFFEYFGLNAGGSLVRRLAPMTPRQRIETLVELAPRGLGRFLIRYRELALIVALNLPGNALIGGGGGIALVAGMSGVFPFRRFVLGIAVAAVPIPLAMAVSAHGLGWLT